MSRSSIIPGVKAAGISDNLPMSRNRSWGIAAKGQQKKNALDFIPVYVYIVSPGYLEAMEMGCSAELAVNCGFYDQAHLANEFRSFSGMNVTTYTATRNPLWTNHTRTE